MALTEGVTEERLRMKIFPYTLKDKAKMWLNSLRPGLLTSWTECPHHGLPTLVLMRIFYKALTVSSKAAVNNYAGGSIKNKTPTECQTLFDTLAIETQHSDTRGKRAGIYEIGSSNAFASKEQVDAITSKLDALLAMNGRVPTQEICSICAVPGHATISCPYGVDFPECLQEQANMVNTYRRPGNDPFSNTYNPGWQRHPNFSWSTTQNVQKPPPGFPPQEKKINLEDALTQLTMSTTQFMTETKTQLQNQSASIRNLEVQAITLRNGRLIKTAVDLDVEKHHQQLRDTEKAEENGRPAAVSSTENSATTAINLEEKTNEQASTNLTPKSYVPPIPFPQRLKKNKKDAQFSKFLEIFKKLQITIPFGEALDQMPNYGKFIKDILSKKRRLEDTEMMELTEECSIVIQSQLPPKRTNISIPCTIGTISFQRALCDLGSSINLMPLSVAKRIGLGEIKKTNISLQMADRSLTYSHGILEDVLVKGDKFIFLADFIVLDMEEDVDTPIILGRPFLITGKMIIDIEKGSLILRDVDQEVEFKVFDATKYPIDSEYCFRLEAVDHVVRPQFIADNPKDPLKASLVHEIEVGEEPHVLEMMNSLETKAVPITIAVRTGTLQRYLEENCNQPKETFTLPDPG
ncbi:uncharacterized protein LOC110752280 [Prunus avium]|uniref:Uncharacterized protein LOC110752280 n=1 Tax=Prunus avium TaxID=42229 RepID=A0A6P5RZF1_PRUAV|nr:uncharacterized protein LOC110752280 [Prunus avium]